MIYVVKIKNWFLKHERRIAPASFILGFVWDNLTLTRIDIWLDNVIILGHLIIAGTSIAFLNIYQEGRIKREFGEKIFHIIPFAMQFSFGALFSAFVVFYSKSASFTSNALFLVFLAFLLVGNEFFRKIYQRLTFQASIYFVALFSYSILIIPTLFKTLGVKIFLASGVLSLILMSLFLSVIAFAAPARVRESWRSLFASVGGIYLFFNLFYFTNIIPPIPLSLKESGVYHKILRNADGNYEVSFESVPWYYFFQETASIFHWKKGEAVYFYSAIFAPAKLTTAVYHRWSYFDETGGGWTETSVVRYQINGGRGGGYRGYTLKEVMFPGKWRVEVLTDTNQVLGRMDFNIVESESTPPLKSGLK